MGLKCLIKELWDLRQEWIKSDQDGIEILFLEYYVKNSIKIKSDQDGIEIKLNSY